MRRPILLALTLTLAAEPSAAGTFERSRIAPELGVDALTRGVTRERLGRDLFANPYATVTIATVDVYDVFPYVEARNFQVVSDPRWNRLVYGESGRTLRAYDGRGSTLGALAEPRGMAVDERNRLYVADAGNNRVVVFDTRTEFGVMELVPRFAIAGLSGPHDVAFSDRGTPFVTDDDVLYVADTGKNRVVAFALEDAGARQIAALGELGSGPGRFAGPMAITTGRSGGCHTSDVYIADAHTRRIVHLSHDAGGLHWVTDVRHEATVLTSLDTDQWGNLYAAAPQQGVVHKFNADLSPVAELRADLTRPRSFHVPFSTVRDHRNGRVERVGMGNGLTIDQWSDRSGVTLWSFGVEVSDLAVLDGELPIASFLLSDQASVQIEIVDASTGQRLMRRDAGALGAGTHRLPLREQDLVTAAGATDLLLRVSATSSYSGGGSHVAQAPFHVKGGASLPSRPMLLGNTPNPVRAQTRIAFVLPELHGERVSLRVYDAAGRMVRNFDRPFAPGFNEVMWDGTDGGGAQVAAGVYFYRLRVGATDFSRRMVRVR